MVFSREQVVDKLSEKSGYWKKDIYKLLKCLDEVIIDCLGEVADDEEVVVQLIRGVKLKCTVVSERNRKDPRTQEDIIVGSTVKPACKFSEYFKKQIQDNYDMKKDG